MVGCDPTTEWSVTIEFERCRMRVSADLLAEPPVMGSTYFFLGELGRGPAGAVARPDANDWVMKTRVAANCDSLDAPLFLEAVRMRRAYLQASSAAGGPPT